MREKTGVDDWKFESYVPADGKVTFTREDFMVEVLEVEYTGGGTAKRISGLPANTRPSDGDRLAAVYEEANPGLVMIRFDPHLRELLLSDLSPDELRCRGAVAVALGGKGEPADPITVAAELTRRLPVQVAQTHTSSMVA